MILSDVLTVTSIKGTEPLFTFESLLHTVFFFVEFFFFLTFEAFSAFGRPFARETHVVLMQCPNSATSSLVCYNLHHENRCKVLSQNAVHLLKPYSIRVRTLLIAVRDVILLWVWVFCW